MDDVNIADSSERRKNVDRRHFAYTFHLPERRNGLDRRSVDDRRDPIQKNRRE